MVKTKYGMISDVHEDPRIVQIAIDILKKRGAKKLLVNGDIGGRMKSVEQSQAYSALILECIGKSGLESYVQPGSHETLKGFHPVIYHFSEKYPNINNILENQKREAKDHHLVFLPGSDFLCDGQYQIGNNKDIETGLYNTKNGSLFYSNMNDLKKLITKPEKKVGTSNA